jgi:gamma-glutamylputrescine oxidase
VATSSLWLDETWRPPQGSRVQSPDVVVVGGGITGCSCALTLAETGLRVRLHEAREIAGGASGRNGGFALRGGAATYDRALAAMGRGPARRLWELSERALTRMEELAGDAFHRTGSLRLAVDEAERDALAAELEALRADGFSVEWVDRLPPGLDRLYSAAILHPPDGAMFPARLVRRLAARAVETGVEVVEGQAVELSELAAPQIVIAVDGLTADVLPELRHVVRPIRGQMLATAPLPERLFNRPHYARYGYDYWLQLPDGRLVVGGRRDASLDTESTSAEETTVLVQARLDCLVEQLVGSLPPVTHRWAGIWGETPDLLPLAGRVPGRDGVWVAGGYSGHGNVLGFACGELVARAILGEAPAELELFDPARFPS